MLRRIFLVVDDLPTDCVHHHQPTVFWKAVLTKPGPFTPKVRKREGEDTDGKIQRTVKEFAELLAIAVERADGTLRSEVNESEAPDKDYDYIRPPNYGFHIEPELVAVEKGVVTIEIDGKPSQILPGIRGKYSKGSPLVTVTIDLRITHLTHRFHIGDYYPTVGVGIEGDLVGWYSEIARGKLNGRLPTAKVRITASSIYKINLFQADMIQGLKMTALSVINSIAVVGVQKFYLYYPHPTHISTLIQNTLSMGWINDRFDKRASEVFVRGLRSKGRYSFSLRLPHYMVNGWGGSAERVREVLKMYPQRLKDIPNDVLTGRYIPGIIGLWLTRGTPPPPFNDPKYSITDNNKWAWLGVE